MKIVEIGTTPLDPMFAEPAQPYTPGRHSGRSEPLGKRLSEANN